MNVLRVAGVAVCIGLLAGCGNSGDPTAAPASPTPSVTPDRWAVEACKAAAKDADLLVFGAAKQSTVEELVDLALKGESAGSMNLIKAWCQKNVPSAGATPDGPVS